MAKARTEKATTGSAMKNAWRLYNAGDVVLARREAQRVSAESPGSNDAEQAKSLVEQTRVPRYAWYLAVFAALLISLMLALGATHHH
jgi:hypothetical protein